MSLDDIRELWRLRRLNRHRMGASDTSELERDFLLFSSKLPPRTLTVELPKLYRLRGNEQAHFVDALASLGLPDGVTAVDISGASSPSFPLDVVVFISLLQLEAAHISPERSYMNALIERIYVEGRPLIRDFTVHEALVGKVSAFRGELNLQEAHLFPERFATGQYRLEVELDTPTHTVKGFLELIALLDEFEKRPKESLLNPEKVKDAVSKSLALREKLGALTRYESAKQVFLAEVPSYVMRKDDFELFYLYSRSAKKNVVVYFGSNPFVKAPNNLLMLDGNDHHDALTSLMDLGIVDVSSAVGQQRLSDLRIAYDEAVRASRTPLTGSLPEFEKCVEELEGAVKSLESIENSAFRRQFASRLNPQILEYIVHPSSDDPVVHDLLPRLSWNSTLRAYHTPLQFMKRFEAAAEEEKRRMLSEISSSIVFNNQQNPDVNRWLYERYRDFSEASGVSFRIIKSPS